MDLGEEEGEAGEGESGDAAQPVGQAPEQGGADQQPGHPEGAGRGVEPGPAAHHTPLPCRAVRHYRRVETPGRAVATVGQCS